MITLVFVNSCLNPLIYRWKLRHIRRTIRMILRNIFVRVTVVQAAGEVESIDYSQSAQLREVKGATCRRKEFLLIAIKTRK